MKKTAVSVIAGLATPLRGRAGLWRRLVSDMSPGQGIRLNPSHAPLGMLDVERITRVSPPVSTLVSRPHSQSKV